METLANLILEVKDELGSDIAALYTADDEYARYLNEGQRRLGYYLEQTSEQSWALAATSSGLPADLHHVDRIVPDSGVRMPPYRVWNGELRFTDPDGASSAGSCLVYYYGYYPTIDTDDASELPGEGDNAIVAYTCYRFMRRLASGRADYTRYATLVGANGVDLDELENLAQGFLDEFELARESLRVQEPVSYYDD